MAFGLKTLKDEKIMDRWGTIIEEGNGRGEYIIDLTQQYLERSEAPGVSWQIGEVTPSLFKALFGNKREYLYITNEGLSDHRMYIGARDYGIHLDVQWYLTAEPRFLKALSSKVITGWGKSLSFALDIFAQQDLNAYVTVVHRCLVDAVITLMGELGQDTSRIDRKSKGVLEVW